MASFSPPPFLGEATESQHEPQPESALESPRPQTGTAKSSAFYGDVFVPDAGGNCGEGSAPITDATAAAAVAAVAAATASSPSAAEVASAASEEAFSQIQQAAAIVHEAKTRVKEAKDHIVTAWDDRSTRDALEKRVYKDKVLLGAQRLIEEAKRKANVEKEQAVQRAQLQGERRVHATAESFESRLQEAIRQANADAQNTVAKLEGRHKQVAWELEGARRRLAASKSLGVADQSDVIRDLQQKLDLAVETSAQHEARVRVLEMQAAIDGGVSSFSAPAAIVHVGKSDADGALDPRELELERAEHAETRARCEALERQLKEGQPGVSREKDQLVEERDQLGSDLAACRYRLQQAERIISEMPEELERVKMDHQLQLEQLQRQGDARIIALQQELARVQSERDRAYAYLEGSSMSSSSNYLAGSATPAHSKRYPGVSGGGSNSARRAVEKHPASGTHKRRTGHKTSSRKSASAKKLMATHVTPKHGGDRHRTGSTKRVASSSKKQSERSSPAGAETAGGVATSLYDAKTGRLIRRARPPTARPSFKAASGATTNIESPVSGHDTSEEYMVELSGWEGAARAGNHDDGGIVDAWGDSPTGDGAGDGAGAQQLSPFYAINKPG